MLGKQQQDQEWSPFVGPRPFKRDPEEQELFFGRNYESERIISLIYSHKLVLVYAQSGAGKTSLFNANIIPALEQKGLQVLPMVRVGIGSQMISKAHQANMVGGSSSLSEHEINPYIFNVFQSLVPDVSGDELLEILTKDRGPVVKDDITKSTSSSKSLSEFLRDFFPHQIDQRGKNIPQILIVDQLEELFTFYSDPNRWHEQQEDFFNQVAHVLENDPLLRIVFIIREDYLAQIDPFAWLLPEKIKARFRLERLHRDAAFEAIKGPLEKSKVYVGEESTKKLFDKGVIEKLIDDLVRIRIETLDGRTQDVKGEFVEPIQLQVVCQRLWNKLRFGKLDEINREYLGDIEKALEDFYVEAIREASEKTHINEDIIRNWFDEKLITSSGTRGIVHRGASSTGGIANSVVDILENRYLIRKEERSGSRWYELTHDRLIKPIKTSNDSWKHERALKRSKRFFKLKIILPVIGAAAILTFFAFLLSPINAASCAVVDARSNVPVGGDPTGISINPNTNLVYVANYLDDVVSVIDCKSNKVIENITVGTSPLGIAVNPITNTIYVANADSDNVSVIDGATNAVEKNVDVGDYPQSVDVNPNTNMIYVANYDSSTISSLDGKTNTVRDEITLGAPPYDIAVNPNTNMIYVANYDSDTTSVIDGRTNTVKEDVIVGGSPQSVDVNPNTNMIYVANYFSDDISVINGTTNIVMENITVGTSPYDVAVNPDTNMIYVANYDSDSISVIVGSTNGVVQTIEAGDRPWAIAVNPNTGMVYVPTFEFGGGITNIINPASNVYKNYIDVDITPRGIAVMPNTNMIYVANADSNTTSVIDGRTNTVTENIDVGASPYDVAVNPDTNMIYVANTVSNTTSVIDGRTNMVTGNVTVGAKPQGVDVNPNTNMIYVANTDSDNVSVIDGTTNTVMENITVGSGPYDVAVNPNTNTIYVANYGAATVSTIDGTTNKVYETDISDVNYCPQAVAIDFLSNFVYVQNGCSNSITVLDDVGGITDVEYPLIGKRSTGIAINPQSKTIYVTDHQSNTVYHVKVGNIPSSAIGSER
jgi:YVTN family beta-propeller protein